MANKSIGNFIAALRKANGLTQRELGERLNVSDKAVSRWERDECAPDLTLIPVIAEIFGITSDELLRGERISNIDTEDSAKTSSKKEKQINRIIDSNLTKFKTISYVSFSLIAFGLILTLVCVYGFYRAVLGYGVGLLFYVASLLIQVISTNRAFAAVCGEEFINDKLVLYKKTVIKYLLAVIYTNITINVCCIPFILMRDRTLSTSIINFSSWVKLIPISLFIAFLINLVISIIASRVIYLNKIFYLDPQLDNKVKKNTLLKLKYLCITAIAIFITYFGQMDFNRFDITNFVNGKTFNNFEDFKEYIEIPKEHIFYYPEVATEKDTQIVSQDSNVNSNINFIESEEVYKDSNGKEYRYQYNNRQVEMIRWSQNNNKLTITTYTGEDLMNANNRIKKFNSLFYFLYVVEIMIGLIAYYKRHI